MQEESTEVAFCPSFNSYTSGELTDAADKVRNEFAFDSKLAEEDERGLDVDDNFEFCVVRCGSNSGADAFTVSADNMFYGGQSHPIFPVFNRDLLLDKGRVLDSRTGEVPSIGIPLRKLFFEDRDPLSSSSSEADEPESLPPSTYCAWTPKASEASPGKCKKSSSTGSCCRRWRFRDLLRRSHSDGKDSFVFLNATGTSAGGKKEEKITEKTERTSKTKQRRSSGEFLSGKSNAKAKLPNELRNEKVLSAHEIFYVKNRALKEGEKRRSYLPYRKDLFGFFANVSGFSRNFPVYPPY
ncbi:uncharacterized protein LOC131168490 [Malania oleifera]|uniref:uncharacterized protein LOC131168490 n=1 Tax=Malania oleifera TaxID=397392 RepID=UPI0025AE07BE|nr:uncharacterized protein LOC131168490 [Malania oleifera]